MRTITYGGAVSLDGFLAGPNEEIDWLHHSKDVQQVMADYWKRIDTILMGRKTWDFAQAHSPSSSSRKSKKSASKAHSSRKPPAIRTYVFSRTLKSIDAPGVELVSTDAAAFVRQLKGKPGKEICLMGGGELAQSLFAADLVDRVGLNIHPILLGSGIPTFRDPGHRIRLQLTECRPLDGGCILTQYAVLRA
jgi:dihydrofolate reductase